VKIVGCSVNANAVVIFVLSLQTGSGTKGKVEKIEKLSNILKESCYYWNSSMLDDRMSKHLVVSLIYTTLGRLSITN
jgi:hypothetical protein